MRTVQGVAFKILTEALKELVMDTCIEFDETGMKIVATDTAHMVLVHMKLHASKFEYYSCPNRKMIGVNMLNFYKLIKTINNNDQLTLYIEHNDINHLCINIENMEKNTRTTYKLNLLDLDHRVINVDPTSFSEVVTLPSTDFQKICRDMHNIAEFMEIRSFRNQITFSCVGEFCSQETTIFDNNKTHKNISPYDEAETSDINSLMKDGCVHPPIPECVVDTEHVRDTTCTEIVQGVFSLKQMVLFTKCTNLCTTAEIYLKNDYPLIIKYDVSSLGSIRLALAPQL
jgi:proliferating cell nuclear antigen